VTKEGETLAAIRVHLGEGFLKRRKSGAGDPRDKGKEA